MWRRWVRPWAALTIPSPGALPARRLARHRSARSPLGRRGRLGRAARALALVARLQPPLVAGDVDGQRDARPQVRARDRLAGDEPDGDVAGPHVELGVLALAVVGAAGRDLRRGLVEREHQHGRRLELL